jgi:elongation factor Ts
MSTVTITAADVNKLRKATGAGMMDCKKALVEADGDFDEAIIVLRKQGQKVAAKRADREASEGYVVAESTGKFGAVVAVNCETDFVAKNDDFVAFANKIMNIAINTGATSLEALKNAEFDAGITVAEKIIEQTGVIGEKIDISYFEIINAEKVVAYNHPGNKIASLVGVNQEAIEESIVRDVAMQVAAMNPVALDETGVSEDIKAREFELGKEQALKEGKPENIVDKIANGKVQKFLKENTLVDQPFIKDNKQSVSQYLNSASSGLKVTEFKRYSLG